MAFTSGLRGGTDNKEWITAEDHPDPEKLPQVLGWNLVLRPINVKDQEGHLIRPEVMREDIRNLTNVGRVLAIGPLAYSDKEKFGDKGPWVKVGDIVAFPRFSGNRFLFKGIRMVLIEDSAMLFILDNASDIDPTYNLGE